MLQDAIKRNRIRTARYQRAEKVLRQVRQRVHDYEDAGKLEKAQKVMATCKRILTPLWEMQRQHRQVGPYSGLTRSELQASGTLETDWY